MSFGSSNIYSLPTPEYPIVPNTLAAAATMNTIFEDFEKAFNDIVSGIVTLEGGPVIAHGLANDGVTDDAAALRAICQAAHAAGIQRVVLPAGTIAHTTLNLTDLNVRLIGQGPNATILKYIGTTASDGIKFGTSQLATSKVYGCGLEDLTLDCNSRARYGVSVTSVYGAVFERIRILQPYAYGMYWTCLDNKLTNAGNESADNQRSTINDLYVECVDVPTAVCVFLDGNAGDDATMHANTSLNHFQNIRLNIRNGDGWVFGYSDDNTLIGLAVFRPSTGGYTGRGLVFSEDLTGKNRPARHNSCYSMHTARGLVVAEGSTAANPSYMNVIYGYSLGNNAANYPPTIEPYATLRVDTAVGPFRQNAAQSVICGLDSITTFTAFANLVRARQLVAGEALRISDRGTNNLRLERPSADFSTVEGEWVVAVTGASGSAGTNLRFTNLIGDGCITALSVAQRVRNVAGSLTLSNSDATVLIDASGGNRVITLPLAASYGAGYTGRLHIYRIDASGNTVTVSRQSSDTLNGGTSETLSVGTGKVYVSNGISAWYSF